ncbi:MAG: hypothetical protein J3K34DRAFT_419048 [Monoraphidium minutum]|nr:MAG: hypothetical protein J3K34DRAFT_419048 [Monoraphidium minutum]
MALLYAVALTGLLIALPAAFAYPQYWVAEGASCGAHPSKQEEHHGAPIPDKATKYVIKGPNGAATTTVCPGTSYSVTVQYPSGQQRLSLNTVAAGTISADKQCPQRFFTPKAARANSASFTWAVPCGVTGPLTIRTTSATGEYGKFNAATTSVAVNAGCAAAACGARRGFF